MRAVERTMAILEAFDPARTSLALKDIADRIELAKPTVFRFVRALEKQGYLVRLENDEYCLSFRFVRLAGLVDSTLGIRQIARPFMTELAKRSNETVTLNMINKRDRVCIDAINSPSQLMSVTRPGEHLPLAAGATAKTLMAYLETKDRDRAVKQARKLSGQSFATITKELARIVRQGYAVTYGEQVPGLGAVSSPIREADNRARYCISVAGPVVRLRPKEKELVALVVRAAADISRQLGSSLVATEG